MKNTQPQHWTLPAIITLLFLWTSACSLTVDPPADSNEKAGASKRDKPKAKPNVPKSWVVGSGTKPPSTPGRWGKRVEPKGAGQLTEWQKEQMAQLEAIGYVSGSKQATEAMGITIFDKKRAVDGLNFYVSGHAPEAYLMDMQGVPLHKWRFEFKKAWPRYPGRVNHVHAEFFRRAYLFENGDILAIFEGMGMIKIDKSSKLLWKSTLEEHHDVKVAGNGDIYVLTRKSGLIPRINPNAKVVEDFITIMSPKGQVKKNVSMIKAFENSKKFGHYWNRDAHNKGDIFHTNTITLLDHPNLPNLPGFKPGNVLTSMYMIDTIAVVDLDKEEIVWAHSGDYIKQHDPQIVEGGNLLLYDNQGGEIAFGKSRIIEYKLPQMAEEWTYTGTGNKPFFSQTCGTAERLLGGNTLITETDNGRAFEITKSGEIVWEYVSPHRAGPQKELIASLFELKRIPKDKVKFLN